jgi:hypothetical protein
MCKIKQPVYYLGTIRSSVLTKDSNSGYWDAFLIFRCLGAFSISRIIPSKNWTDFSKWSENLVVLMSHVLDRFQRLFSFSFFLRGPSTRVARFFLTQNTKSGENVPQMYHKVTKWPWNISNGCNMFQMGIKYTNIFHSKGLQNLPNLGFWLEKYHLATLHSTKRLDHFDISWLCLQMQPN